MKKSKWVITLILTVWISLLFGSIVLAKDTYKIVNLKANKTVDMKQCEYNDKTGDYTYYQYKIVIPATGYINVNMKSDYEVDIDINVYKKKQGDKPFFTFSSGDFGNGKICIPFNKGTYYLEYDAEGVYSCSFRYSFSKASFPANYCKAKAMTLPRGKKVTVCQVPGKSYDRWFKIVLTKKRKISIWGSNVLYDNKRFRMMKWKPGGDHRIYTLPKGTYYFKSDFQSYIWSHIETYYVTTVYWK